MTQLVEHGSVRAARILDSVRELVPEHGVRKVTGAEIAQAAGVGKGTVYLYWPAKDDLVLGLFAREVLAHLDEVTARLTGDPTLVLPRRLAPLVMGLTLGNPLLLRLLAGEADLVTPTTAQCGGGGPGLADSSPGALTIAVLPVLRRHGLARTDRALATQAYALHATMLGLHQAATLPGARGPPARGRSRGRPRRTVHGSPNPPTPPTRPSSPRRRSRWGRRSGRSRRGARPHHRRRARVEAHDRPMTAPV